MWWLHDLPNEQAFLPFILFLPNMNSILLYYFAQVERQIIQQKNKKKIEMKELTILTSTSLLYPKSLLALLANIM